MPLNIERIFILKSQKNLNWGRYQTITSPKIARLNAFYESIPSVIAGFYKI